MRNWIRNEAEKTAGADAFALPTPVLWKNEVVKKDRNLGSFCFSSRTQ